MTETDTKNMKQNIGGLDSFEEARNVEELPEGELSHRQALSGEAYFVEVMQGSNEDGSLKERGSTIYVHRRVKWYYNIISFSSDCWAWTTNSNGELVEVDRLEAHLTHSGHYPDQVDTKTNATRAHAFFRITGIPVYKVDICGWSCAEKNGYGRWCTKKWCS